MAEIRDVQINLFQARATQIKGQIAILEQRVEQFTDQIDGLEAQRVAAEAQIVLIEDEIRRYEQVAALQLPMCVINYSEKRTGANSGASWAKLMQTRPALRYPLAKRALRFCKSNAHFKRLWQQS